MCGIVAGIRHGNILPVLLHGLRQLEYRGYDSAGVALQTDHGVRTVKTAGRVALLEDAVRAETDFCGGMGIAHTRWATHGAPETRNAHPHTGMRGIYTVVHNGILENYQSLRAELESGGTVFLSETDTEAFANLLERLDTGDPLQTLRKACARVRGSYAFAVLCAYTPDRFYCARSGSPLLIGIGADRVMVSSDSLALEGCDTVYRLDNGEAAMCSADGVRILDRFGNETAKTPETVSAASAQTDKGGFDTFMEKEMLEQPDSLARTIEAPLDLPAATAQRIYLIGCGSAYHAAMAGAYLLSSRLGIPCTAEMASEFRYGYSPVDPQTLVICISQSGETADTLAALRKAKAAGAQTFSIVNTPHSTLAVESDGVFLTRAGREVAVATTKAYTAQLAALIRICADRAADDELRSALRTLPQKAALALQTESAAKALAQKYYACPNAYYIGRGTDYPSAMEGSLKMRELCYMDAHAYAAGELKHGTISLVQRGTLCVAVCCAERLADKTISAMEELRARGATLLCVTTQSLSRIVPADDLLVVPDAPEPLMPCLSVIPMQFFARFCAKNRNCDIDKPRNLAKSVTVE